MNPSPLLRSGAKVAQVVEQRTENPRVGSSILSLGTIIKPLKHTAFGGFAPIMGPVFARTAVPRTAGCKDPNPGRARRHPATRFATPYEFFCCARKRLDEYDRKSTRLNSSHKGAPRM